MPKPRAYVETTIPSFYYDFRDSPAITLRREATRRWWADAAALYQLVTSLTVQDELAAGTGKAVSLRLGLATSLPVLPIVREIDEIVDVYLMNKLMPTRNSEDAVHLALASFYKCDFIVTWNCRHLANPNKAVHIQRINSRLGLGVPSVRTPLDLLKGASDE
jgi:predicted nucleic acid-binding protein